MSTDASIAMSVKDNLSQAIVGMKNSVTNFRSDITALQNELEQLNATRVQMRMDLSGAKREAQQAKKAFEDLGDSATEAERKAAEADWRKAEENLDNIRQQYDLVSRQVRQTTRDMENASGAISRAENRVGGAGETGVLAALGKAGIINMVGDSAGQWANTLVGSAFGSDVGTVFSSGLSSAVQGAAMGSLAGPVGTAVGAAIGGAIGLATGGSQIFQQRDEAFKSYVQEATQNQMEELTSSISSGSDTAAQRELDAIAFRKLITGGEGSEAFLSDLTEVAANTPFEYSDLTAISKNLSIGFGSDPSRILSLINGIGNAGATVGASANDMQWLATALSRMQSTDLAQLGEINMFQDRGIDVIGMLAEYYGKGEGDIRSMISGGEIGGRDAVSIIEKGLEQYAGAMDEMAKTFSGLESTLSDAQTELNNAYGEGYNETRKQGLREEINWLSGESGAMMQEANRAMGAWQAELENSKEQYVRDAMEAVMNSDDYKNAMSEGSDEGYAQAGRMLMEAKVRGMNEYNASEGAQLMVEYEIALADTIREDASTNSAYWDAGYRKGQEYSKGLIAGQAASTGFNLFDQEDAERFNEEALNTQDRNWAMLNGYDEKPNAWGLDRVPYDNYPALLHQGERVLTAREAREQDGGRKSPIQITITGNSFGAGVSAEEIAQRLADQIELHLAAGVLS